MRQPLSAVVAGLVAVLLLPAASALADGSTMISNATPIVFGQQEFGNALDGVFSTFSEGGCSDDTGYDSWWSMAVTADDSLTVTMQAPQTGDQLWVYPVGTTDYTIDQANPSETVSLNSLGLAQVSFIAPRTGLMPVDAGYDSECSRNGEPAGAYDFTFTVKHAVRLALPHVSRLGRRGTLAVGVHNPDGVGISDASLTVSLQAHVRGGPWQTIGTASATSGTARVVYKFSRRFFHRTASVRAQASGASYTMTSTPNEEAIVR